MHNFVRIHIITMIFLMGCQLPTEPPVQKESHTIVSPLTLNDLVGTWTQNQSWDEPWYINGNLTVRHIEHVETTVFTAEGNYSYASKVLTTYPNNPEISGVNFYGGGEASVSFESGYVVYTFSRQRSSNTPFADAESGWAASDLILKSPSLLLDGRLLIANQDWEDQKVFKKVPGLIPGVDSDKWVCDTFVTVSGNTINWSESLELSAGEWGYNFNQTGSFPRTRSEISGSYTQAGDYLDFSFAELTSSDDLWLTQRFLQWGDFLITNPTSHIVGLQKQN